MINIKNLSKNFKDGKMNICALNDISLKINQGEIISIIGKTGSGKSTLLNVILGITKPTKGEIIIDDILINNKSKKRELRKITKLVLSSFQYPDHQLFNPKVKDEILYNSKDEKLMYELMETMNFPENLFDRSPFNLSSGQKRKLILISLLMQKPKILLLDESTAFLDSKSRVDFLKVLIKINKNYNTTIIFISHNVEDVRRLDGKTYLLDKGKVVYSGSSEDVLKVYERRNYE